MVRIHVPEYCPTDNNQSRTADPGHHPAIHAFLLLGGSLFNYLELLRLGGDIPGNRFFGIRCNRFFDLLGRLIDQGGTATVSAAASGAISKETTSF